MHQCARFISLRPPNVQTIGSLGKCGFWKAQWLALCFLYKNNVKQVINYFYFTYHHVFHRAAFLKHDIHDHYIHQYESQYIGPQASSVHPLYIVGLDWILSWFPI